MRATVFAHLLLLLVPAYSREYLYFPSSDVAFVNETIFPQSNESTLEALSAACDATPGCLGFNMHGWLKNGTSSLSPGLVDSYFLAPTPPLPEPTYLWPQPVSFTIGAGRVLVSSSLVFTEVGAPTPTPDLAAAFTRFQALLFSRGSYDGLKEVAGMKGLPTLTSVLVSVVNASTPLDVGVDESYTLSVPSDGTPIALNSNTVWGALQGLQTLSQLVSFDSDSLSYWSPAPVSIQDAPKFAYRGVMVDPARQFLPPSVLRAVVDSLTLVKLNVLHVHLLDCDSFPLQVPPPYSALWKGSFSPRERYTTKELADFSEYARVRGVVVVYEFDQPGHMGAMCVGVPSLCPTPACSAAYGGDVLDPSSPDTLPAMRAVVATLAAVSPSSSILHLGGDEVNPACWLASPAVVAWMATHNASTGDDVYRYFVTQSNAMAVGVGKSPMRWEEVWRHFGTSLHPSTIVHAWLSSQAMFEAASAGYRTVFSVNSAAYYLDYLDVQWDRVYGVDVLDGLTNTSSLPFILGGQLCAWGETMDAASVLSIIWPRAAAAAERLWSYNFRDSNATSWDTINRLAQLRCTMLERGIPATLPGVDNAGDLRPAWTVGSCSGGYRKLC